MTFKRLKATTNGLLTGDNVLTANSESLLGLLEMAYNDVIAHADALHLMTLNRSGDIFRLAQGKYVVRVPELPVDDDDELDIDNELCFAVARFLASYMSDKKSAVHFEEAKRLVRNYNSKVFEILETIKDQGDGTYDTNPTHYA
jgi:hypothetical protein